ncbi:hypothetical protein EYF80_039779 [Liparis tanakae]|uniref:Uncharacterized protein n=1 Tax=Liparis tanakae TaxID=230148 RepID=A0A4Z2G951_9TELE|nr:hypothetical protein EYF80_039779 [Liparis tanakae]
MAGGVTALRLAALGLATWINVTGMTMLWPQETLPMEMEAETAAWGSTALMGGSGAVDDELGRRVEVREQQLRLVGVEARLDGQTGADLLPGEGAALQAARHQQAGPGHAERTGPRVRHRLQGDGAGVGAWGKKTESRDEFVIDTSLAGKSMASLLKPRWQLTEVSGCSCEMASVWAGEQSQCRTDEVGSRPPGGEEDLRFLADPDGRSLRRRSRPRRRLHYDLQRHAEEEQPPRNHEQYICLLKDHVAVSPSGLVNWALKQTTSPTTSLWASSG